MKCGKTMMVSPNNCFDLDPLPTVLLKPCIDDVGLFGIVTNILTVSMRIGIHFFR